MNSSLSAESKAGPGRWLLYLLAVIGVVLIIKRFMFGLGSVTNLNDAYP